MMYKTDINNMRECSQCGEVKHLNYFHTTTLTMKNGRKWKGYHPSCKRCRNKKRMEKYYDLRNMRRDSKPETPQISAI